MNLNRKKLTGLALLAGFVTLGVQAQTNPQVREVGDFTGIKVGDQFNVIISQSEANTLTINTESGGQSQVKTEVKDGILLISNDKGEMPVSVRIGVKNINSIEVTGLADVKTDNQLVCDKLTVASNGAGKVDLDLKANEVKITVSGVGDVVLSGTTAGLDARVSGTGYLKATDLEADKVIAKVSGVGDAKVNVKQSIDADVSGSGSIIFKGDPKERNVNITGAGSVRESKIGTGEETASDTTKFQLGKRKYMIIGDDEVLTDKRGKDKDRDFKNWSGYEIGVNGFLDYKNSLDVPSGSSFIELNYPRSIQFGLNLMEKDFHIYKNHVNVVTGLGFDFNHYALMNNVTLNGGSEVLTASMDSVEYKKNTLNVSYLKVPLMLEINTGSKPDNNFHIAAGAEFAYRIHSVAKQKYEQDDRNHKSKQRDDFNLEPFRYSALLRIGYNGVTVYASYGLNRLFKKNKGPQVYPFSIGVNISV
jgi:hypothetical protein